MAGPKQPAESILSGASEHQRAGRPEAAEALYLQALRERPENGAALRLYGTFLADVGRLGEAAGYLRRAVALDDGVAGGHYRLGLVLQCQGNDVGAITSFRRALEIEPGYADAHCAIASAYAAAGAPALAANHLRAATAHAPVDPRPHFELGALLAGEGAHEAALGHHREALARRPGYAEAMLGAAVALEALGQHDESLGWYDRAIRARRQWPDAHWRRARARLRMGDFDRGLAEYEWRWRAGGFSSEWAGYSYPVWNGALVDGRRVLVWSEQGPGEQILFAGSVPDLLDSGAACVLTCDERLVALFSRAFPSARVMPEGTKDDPALTGLGIDLQCPIGSLARWLPPAMAGGPRHDGYLEADPGVADACRRRYDALGGGLKVGIAWREGAVSEDAVRSIDLDRWRDILALPSVRYINLQAGDVGREIALVRGAFGIGVHEDPAVDRGESLDAFAAQLSALDLVIAADGLTAHLAGALGKPVWMLLPHVADWCWMAGRADSPWHPTARLYRQAHPGDWDPVLDAVRRDLAAVPA